MLIFSLLFACSEYELNNITFPEQGTEKDNSLDLSTDSLIEDDGEEVYENITEISTGSECDGNAPPELITWTPDSQSILDVGDTLLEAWVHDEDGDDVMITWLDDSGVIIGEGFADENGYLAVQWMDERSIGEQQVTIQIQDECVQKDTEFQVCQEAGYEQDELQLEKWHLEGDAEILSDGSLELTGLNTFQLGSAFMTDEIVLANEVEIRFEYKTEGGTGADGISLTALDTTRMTSFLGGAGCGIGYGGNTSCTDGEGLPGWSIELDSWFNGELPDPTSHDHVAMSFDGEIANPVVWSPVHELEETGWHTVEILVNAPRIRVVIDNYLYIDEDVEGDFDFPAYIGFTGSTGGQTNLHTIRGLKVQESVCADEVEEEREYLIPEDLPEATSDFDFTYHADSDWGAGYCGRIVVQNNGTTAGVWSYPYAIDGQMQSSWGSVVTEDSGSWIFQGENHNRSVDAGQQTSFGFCVNR